MESTTAIGDATADVTRSTGRHGDVDKNGDLVDELTTVLRLRAAISAATPAEEEAQLRAVVGMLRRRGFVEVPS